jgi:hypothetical protein
MIRKNEKMAKMRHAIINALKQELSTQHYEQSTTAHMVRKLLMAVVAFGTIIPNRPSIITLFGCFQCLDFQIKDLLYLILDQHAKALVKQKQNSANTLYSVGNMMKRGVCGCPKCGQNHALHRVKQV